MKSVFLVLLFALAACQITSVAPTSLETQDGRPCNGGSHCTGGR
jgi:hypothetical protein